MRKRKVDITGGSGRADPVAAPARSQAGPTQDLVAMAAAVGVVAAGVALLEVALIPGIVIGGAAVLAPRYLSGRYAPKKLLPELRRRVRPLINSTIRRRTAPAPPRPGAEPPPATLGGFAIKQAVAKTITFRIIVTTLDFTTNYVVIGELGTAVGLSGITLVVGPLFYLGHETAWNYFGPPVEGKAGGRGPAVDLPLPGSLRPDARVSLTINRALAKTITFRTIATAIDFTTNYVVVGELATAAVLSAFAFVVGPFVYLGHEMAWDYFGSPTKPLHAPGA